MRAPSSARSRVRAGSTRFRSQQNTLHHVKYQSLSRKTEGRRSQSPGFWLPRCVYTEVRARWLHRAWRSRSSRSDELPLVTNRLWRLVEVNGIEPMTSCLQSRRSPN